MYSKTILRSLVRASISIYFPINLTPIDFPLELYDQQNTYSHKTDTALRVVGYI